MAELDPSLYTVAWIAPLEIEAQAALHLLDNRHQGRFPLTPRDDYIFQAGDACGHNVIIATLPAGEVYGTRSAAALATQVKNLWFGLLVGIAAGLPNLSRNPPLDIRLGDVLVGLPVGDNAGLIDYDLGKETGTDGFQLLRAGHALAKTPTVVRSALGSIKLRAPDDSNDIIQQYKIIEHKEHSLGTFADPGQGRDTLYQVNESGIESPVIRGRRPDSKRIRVWYGSIGSGDKLMKNAQKRNELRDKYNVIGLEMEAAGTMDQIPVGVIRGVCDYGDEHKNDEWQPYAAAMAAAYARVVLAEIRPKNMVQMPLVNLSPKRKPDQEDSASEHEHRKRQCYTKGKEYSVVEMMDTEVKKSLIEQLYLDKIDERLITLTAAQGKTCRWFLDKDEYISWNDVSQQPDHGGFLWVKGHPGTGKSTLMKFLFERVKINAKGDSLQIILSFFFLARDMVCFFEELCETAQESQVRLQVCFSSRHYPMITIAKGNEVVLEAERGHIEDIEYYIKSKLRLGKSAQALSLRSEILNRSSNIFLWVVLVLDILNREYPNSSISVKKMRDRLKEIPPELNDLFQMILTRDGESLDRLHICLTWILFANRPLKPQELYFAVQLSYDEECSGYWDENDIELEEMKTFVRSSSKGLAEVTRNKASEVQFIHESVRDFLLSKYESQWSEAPGSFMGNGHNLLRDCCLAQLNNLALQDAGIADPLPPAFETAELRQTIRSNYPFLEYSILNSFQHADSAQQNGIDQEHFFIDFPLKKWILLHNTLEQHQIRRYTNTISLLYILAERNLVSLIAVHPEGFSFFDTEFEIERYGTPIFAALATNNREAVNVFLGMLAAILPPESPFHELCELHRRNTTSSRIFRRDFGYKRQTGILHCLRIEGDETLILAFLLWLGLSASSRRVLGRAFVPGAFEHKCERIWGLELNGRDLQGHTPLAWAAESGYESVVQLLPAQDGVELDSKSCTRWTPLFSAAVNGHEAVVQMLLKKGADPDCKSTNKETPLLYASQNGHEAIVQPLLTRGADLGWKDDWGYTPLSRAAENGHEAVVQLLLAKGADPNCKENYGRTPLSLAAANGHEAVVQLLLTKGADPDCKDNNGQTPLSHAAGSDHTANYCSAAVWANGINPDCENEDNETAATD
ncbi:uncharacterized protein Triagg1_2920 [Trichoderma aggressivum f. europaeum]|uniref:Nephrocystin 3-like N-terminal domain-containing protein n=1 Tax=Trichoderma aggressivum f. europaeum TaxID=173218 RepID=A0AAE1IFX5_9HYPO|nr:hypothetical protein Triagg1_2920 [Trichoderma aggressivum f. europaeum]